MSHLKANIPEFHIFWIKYRACMIFKIVCKFFGNNEKLNNFTAVPAIKLKLILFDG